MTTEWRERLTPAHRREIARHAALERWSNIPKDDPRRFEATLAARDALEAKWDANPDPVAAKAAHMARMRLVALRNRQRRVIGP